MLAIAPWKENAATPSSPVVGKSLILAPKYRSCSGKQTTGWVVESIIHIDVQLEEQDFM
jgi:hypothetical protein